MTGDELRIQMRSLNNLEPEGVVNRRLTFRTFSI